MAAWPSGHHTGKAAPRHGVNPTKTSQHSHPTDDPKFAKCQERASVILQNVKKPHQLPKGHQYIVYKITVIICNSPTRRSKMMSRKNDEPLSLVQATRAHQTSSSKFNTVLWRNQDWFQCSDPQTDVHLQEALVPPEQSTQFPCNLFAKSYITSEIMNWYSCMKHKREVKQTFTWSSLHNISDSHYIQMNRTNPNYLMNFPKHFFSPFCISTVCWQLWNHWNFFTCYGERCFIQGSRHNTDAPTALMLTKCVNALTGNLPDFH